MTSFTFNEPDVESFQLADSYSFRGDKLHIGNGDPVVVYSPETGATCLGTGMSCLEDVVYATAKTVGVTDGERFDVFLPASAMHFEKVDPR